MVVDDSEKAAGSFAALQFLGRFSSRPALPLRTPVVLIGSGAQAQVRLKGRGVAAAHALLMCDRSETFLRALGPGAVTLVNGAEVSEATLADGDVVRVGTFEFRYSSAAAKNESTRGTQGLELRDSAGVVGLRERVTLIGSGAFCDLVVSGQGVEAVHAAVVRAEAGLILRDLVSAAEGTAPVLVNGRAVRQAVLAEGDVVRMGSSEWKCARMESPPPGLRPVTAGRLKRRRVALAAAEPVPRAEHSDDAVEGQIEIEALGETVAGGRRVPVVLPVLAAMVCMAGAAAAVWRFVPVEHVVQGAVSFERPADLPEAKVRELLREKEVLLVDEEVRRLAGKKLGAVEPDFVARPSELGRRGGVRHETSGGRAAMVVWVRGRDAAGDAARLDALLGAVYEHQSADGPKDVAGLREQLVAGEIAELEKELAWRNRWAEQLRKDLKMLEADAPAGPQLELLKERVAGLRRSMEAAVEARIVAQRELAELQPATAPAATGPVEKVKRAQAALARTKGVEGKVRAELAGAEEQLGRAANAARELSERQWRLDEVATQVKELEGSLSAKRERLARGRAEAPARVRAMRPEGARVVAVEDRRGLIVAGAVGLVAVLFMMGFAARLRRGAAAS